MFYKGLKGAASILTRGIVPPNRHTMNHHSLAFQTPLARTNIYKSSFFPTHYKRLELPNLKNLFVVQKNVISVMLLKMNFISF